jgi:predicted AlkP superfamily pyrophosphatase or phosphodiesterase
MYPVASGSGSTVLRAAQDHVDLQADFYTFQFNDSDTKIHKLGSEGLARRMIASEIDRNIKELVRLFQHKYHQIKLVIIGDHGMMDCSIAIDVWHLMVSFARKSGLRQFKDYLLFIDSTMARVWFLSDLAAELFDDVRSLDVLQSHGRFMSDELCQQYRIPALGKKYGELIWWANPGVLIHPCYWHSKKDEIKAMHGYDTYHDKMKGFAIVSCDLAKPAFIQEARLVDICPTLCDLIGVRYPEKNEGKSLLKQASESRGG